MVLLSDSNTTFKGASGITNFENFEIILSLLLLGEGLNLKLHILLSGHRLRLKYYSFG